MSARCQRRSRTCRPAKALEAYERPPPRRSGDHSRLDLPLVEQAALAALGEDDFAKAHQHGPTYTTVDRVHELIAEGVRQ